MNSKFKISYDKLTNFYKISTGQSSKVQKATLKREDGSEVDVATKTYVDFKASEIDIIAELQHENVIKFIGAVMEHDKKILIMELAPDGNLYNFLRKQNKRLSFDHSLEWAKQCSNAVAYLHSQIPVIIHRDIKSPNFLLSADFTEKSFHVLKLCDFGISHQVKDSATLTQASVVGLTCQWAAPEIINGPENCSIFSDVYSLAVVIWELFTGEKPYEGVGDFKIRCQICGGKTLSVESINDRLVCDLLKKCWRGEDEMTYRPKARRVVELLNAITDDVVPDSADGLEVPTSELSLYESVQKFIPRNSQPMSPHRVVTRQELQELERFLGKHWKSFGLILGFMEEEIDVFEINNQINVKDAMHDMLNGWKNKFGKEATVGKLVDHLDHFEHINPEYYTFLINDTMKD